MTHKINGLTILMLVGLFLVIISCAVTAPRKPVIPDREELIPAEQVKVSPQTDAYPPKSETQAYENPVPLPYPVNTAGAEDSAFIMPDGNTLYVWFTPDVTQPAEEQVSDGVTGIYVFHKTNGKWGDPERVILQDAGKLALDGCEFVLNEKMWFCSAREGYTGLHWFTAELVDGKWQNWQLSDFKPEYEVGELHITTDGNELYFHSARQGGNGGYDIWESKNLNGDWQYPGNVENVNSAETDGWPFITQDGRELWFTRSAGAPELFRSIKVKGTWDEPEKMFSNFAGEASLDNIGNVYFTHHYYRDGHMLEADIYFAKKR